MKDEAIFGYTAGVFDLFHVGHVNLLSSARSMCDHLTVGVSSDELVAYKNKKPVIPYEERIAVVRACRFVDTAIEQENLDKFEAWKKLHYDVLFVGSDWFETSSWSETEERLQLVGVKVVYLPYTKGTTSTLINETLKKLRS